MRYLGFSRLVLHCGWRSGSSKSAPAARLARAQLGGWPESGLIVSTLLAFLVYDRLHVATVAAAQPTHQNQTQASLGSKK
jgi:hypothetical protein